MSDRFATTQWSRVLDARDGSATTAHEALEALCESYWFPLYAYVRRKGHSPEDARDLTQGFFADLLERDFLARVDPAKGRFRSFLLKSIQNFLSHESQRARALKRGGGAAPISLDAEAAEKRYGNEPAETLTPEQVFERRWALTMLQRAMARLRQEAAASGTAARFEQLRSYLTEAETRLRYRETAEKLEMSEAAVKTAVHRLRKRYGACLRAEIAETVADPGEIDDEVRHLLQISCL